MSAGWCTKLATRTKRMRSRDDSPILVTGAAGDIGAVGRNVTSMLLAKGRKVRALVRREGTSALKPSGGSAPK